MQIEFYEQSIEKLTSSALKVIDSTDELKKKFELITSVKGIANACAIQILGERVMLPSNLTKKQRVTFAGLDPRVYESGTSINKKHVFPKPVTDY